MFNKELMRERRQMVIQQLLYDNIYNLKLEMGEGISVRSKLEVERKITELYKIYNNVDSDDVTLMNKSSKEKIIQLLEERISSIEDDMPKHKNETSEISLGLVKFILYEYKVLLRDFLESLINDNTVSIKKNSN